MPTSGSVLIPVPNSTSSLDNALNNKGIAEAERGSAGLVFQMDIIDHARTVAIPEFPSCVKPRKFQ